MCLNRSDIPRPNRAGLRFLLDLKIMINAERRAFTRLNNV
jgi:hypothetical protein